MITVRIPQRLSSTLETTADTIDRDDRLQLEQWVLGEHGKSLGTLDELQRDQTTGHVSGIIVRREIVSQRRLVPVNLVTAVTPRSVQIQMTRAAFKRLPQLST
jgi:hypothetical protein